MSVIQCPTCDDFIDTDMEDYDFELNECEQCIFMKGKKMKIEEVVSSEKFSEDNDYRSFLQIKIDGKKAFSFTDGEPEDANLGRDFSDCFGIVSAIQKAYLAGKNGEVLELSEDESDDWI
jgi:hypothetical protein